MAENIDVKVTLTAVDKASKNVRSFKDTTVKASDEITKSNEKIKKSFISMRTAIAGVVTVIGAGFAKSLIDTQVSINRYERSLKVATGSTENAAREVKFLKEESQRLGLEFNTVALSYSQLAAATKNTNLSIEQTREIFLGTAEAGAALGLSAYDMEGALRAMQQMVSKGTVQAEELRGQLGERIPGAFNMAAKAMGVTTQQLGKMLEQGQVTAEEMLPRLANEMRNAFGKDAQDGAQQMAGQINLLKNSIFEAKQEIIEGGFGELMVNMAKIAIPAIKDLANGFVFISQTIQSGMIAAMSVVSSFASGFIGMVTEIAKVIDKIPGSPIPDGWISSLEETKKKLFELGEDGLKVARKEWEKGLPTKSNLLDHLFEVENQAKATKQSLKDLPPPEATGTKPVDEKAIERQLELQYEIRQLTLEAQEQTELQQIELVKLGFERMRNVTLNEKAKDLKYLKALKNKEQSEIARIEAEWLKKRADKEKEINEARMQAQFQMAQNILQTMDILSDGSKKWAAFNKIIGMGQIILNTSQAIMKTLAQGGMFAIPMAATIGAMGAANLAKAASIKTAAKGADFITDGPQLMMVGENSGGKERVQVTPMSSPNYEGPKSTGGNVRFGDININVGSGGEMVEMLKNNPDEFNDLLKEGMKRGAFEGVL